MKYGKLILILILVLLLGGIFLFFFFRTSNQPSPSQTETTNTTTSIPDVSAAAVASGFYTWYLRGLTTDQAFDSSVAFTSQIKNWLTPKFSASYAAIASNSDSDPFLLTQDYQNSWSSNIQTAIISQGTTASDILVSLGTPAELQQIVVHLVFLNNSWKIDSVTTPS